MALVYIKNVEGNSKLGLWEITEEISELKKIFKKEIPPEKLHTDKSAREYICTRMLLETMLNKEVDIVYRETGKPYIENSEIEISISHSSDYVCVLLNKKDRVGVDIQVFKPKIIRLKERFLNEMELKQLPSGDPEKALHLYWGCKEALYKWWSRDGLDIKNNLRVMPFIVENTGLITGFINFENIKSVVSLRYELFGNYFLVYTISG